ncbi:MAG: Gfo/Idh/MocA family oxidoreductase [Clostridia bacterium]|nr:Gfo/Idh/MocA family oxidoreductase [Clostridia bacterium]
MKDIAIAVIGWGFMGRMHTHALRSIPLMYKNISFRPVLKCLCSGHMENAREGMAEAGFESCTDDWKTLLNRDDIDAVSICTPNSLHEEMAIAFLKAGKHVYLDKPLTTDLASAYRIYDAAKASNAKLQLVMNNRFLPATLRAKELATEGRLGNILSFSCRYLHSGSIDPQKPIGWKQGLEGGVLLDLGTHILDLVTGICGYPEKVFCATNSLYPERPTKDGAKTDKLSEDHAVLTMRLQNGALGTCEAGKIQTGENDELAFEIYGDKGAIKFDLMEPNWLWYYDNTLPEKPYGGDRGFKRIEAVARYPQPAGSFLPPKNTIGWDRGHIHCYYSFLNAVANDLPVDCDIEQALRLQKLIEAAKRSAAREQWEKVE